VFGCGGVALFYFQTTEFPKGQEFWSDKALSSVFLASEELSTEVYDERAAHRVYRKWLLCCRRLQQRSKAFHSLGLRLP
jgi:hypothetical protein